MSPPPGAPPRRIARSSLIMGASTRHADAPPLATRAGGTPRRNGVASPMINNEAIGGGRVPTRGARDERARRPHPHTGRRDRRSHVERDGAVGIIRLDRPPVNAINKAMHEQLFRAATELAADATVRAVVVHGGRKAFAAGADISQMADMGRRRSRCSAVA